MSSTLTPAHSPITHHGCAPSSWAASPRPHRGGELLIDLDNALVPGTPPGGGTGTGLLGLAERATAVGGTVRAGPEGGTWRVRAALPAPAANGALR